MYIKKGKLKKKAIKTLDYYTLLVLNISFFFPRLPEPKPDN